MVKTNDMVPLNKYYSCKILLFYMENNAICSKHYHWFVSVKHQTSGLLIFYL